MISVINDVDAKTEKAEINAATSHRSIALIVN